MGVVDCDGLNDGWVVNGGVRKFIQGGKLKIISRSIGKKKKSNLRGGIGPMWIRIWWWW